MSFTASDAVRQAGMTAHDYLVRAKSDIDEVFGEGYAKKNPCLVAAYMQVACADFSTAIFAGAVDDIPGLAEALAGLGRSLESKR